MVHRSYDQYCPIAAALDVRRRSLDPADHARADDGRPPLHRPARPRCPGIAPNLLADGCATSRPTASSSSASCRRRPPAPSTRRRPTVGRGAGAAAWPASASTGWLRRATDEVRPEMAVYGMMAPFHVRGGRRALPRPPRDRRRGRSTSSPTASASRRAREPDGAGRRRDGAGSGSGRRPAGRPSARSGGRARTGPADRALRPDVRARSPHGRARRCSDRSLPGRGPADRDVRLRLRRPDRRPGPDRPAAGRGPRLHRRHRPLPVRAQAARRRARLRPPSWPGASSRTTTSRRVVVACNTAAAAGLDDLRAELPVPVLDVIGPGATSLVAGHGVGPGRRDRHRRHDRLRRLPARRRRRRRGAPASTSS